jgi:SPX domain protein involved in polyphosphate accumulation
MSMPNNRQEQFVSAWDKEQEDYIVFSDYRRNEGRRRLQDIVELIEHAMKRIDQSDPVTASTIYVETLRDVAMLTKWSKVLESSAIRHSS